MTVMNSYNVDFAELEDKYLTNCFISINTSLKWCVKAKKILGGMEETSI